LSLTRDRALNAPIFCTNTAYFATLRHWHAEQLRRRRLLIVDEAHNLESQLVGVFTVRFSHDEMRGWFGHTLPRLPQADDYRPILSEHVVRLEGRLAEIGRALEAQRPPELPQDLFLGLPPTREEQELLEQRDVLETALARLTFFLDAEDREWIVRYPDTPGAALALVPLSVAAMARELLGECAEVTVLLQLPRTPRGPGRGISTSPSCGASPPPRRSCSSSDPSFIAPSARCRRPPCPGWSPRCSPRSRQSSPPIPATRD
jgi:Rad3-related DNA helicase